jgi:hypothetical protein
MGTAGPRSRPFLTGSRPLVEQAVRQRVLADRRISTIEGVDVVGLAGDRTRVTGVLVRRRVPIRPSRRRCRPIS